MPNGSVTGCQFTICLGFFLEALFSVLVCGLDFFMCHLCKSRETDGFFSRLQNAVSWMSYGGETLIIYGFMSLGCPAGTGCKWMK